MDLLAHSARGIDEFLLYLVAALALLALFICIYIWITPYKELTLIRQGNVAAAASLSGTVLGFAIALAVQIFVFFVVTRLLVPGLARDIPEGKLAPGILLGTVSLATGILNAACMT